ncbi:hypothetical protein LTR93_005547 [Exophiala xenobiotica]|nr:hypothetical protein LTR93_005547 [Exophiala xenobiotica]KAK5404172.1 hypothetical protein LTR06_010105 [Exophiala xenobiotica]
MASFMSYTDMLLAVTTLLAFVLICYAFYLRYQPYVRDIPGPFLASFTDLWRMLKVHGGRFELSNQALHAKYGDLVRVGPNCISVGDPHEIRQIYGITRLFEKSEYYRVAQPIVNGKRVASLFMINDEKQHQAAKRPIANAYSMTTLLDYEPFVDSTSKLFVERMNTLYANTGKVCDFGEWLQWYAFDVIGEMTFGRRFGFLEQGKDVANMIDVVQDSGWYTAVIGQMPWLDFLLAKNPFIETSWAKQKGAISSFVMTFLGPRIEEAIRVRNGEEKVVKDRTDFTAKFIAAADKYHGKIPAQQLLGWSLSNINAGSDSTAITLRAIFYFLCLNPHAMRRLREELDTANLSALPRYKETNHLPYLNVVIKEAIRLHAPVGVILERLVPEGGVTLCGHFFPKGTIVGCNPAVVHMDKRVYGRKYPVTQYQPERWLEATEEEKAEMERLFMAFGSGKRTCIGKNISLLEVYKLVPLLLSKFNFKLMDPKKKLKIWNTFFVHQKGLEMLIEPRSTLP